ncbi:Protein ECERIFERUM 26-like [Vitis vinifera]|uniref:Protein ECERIFERUM 26-like n=1 Tax=Vitis vinifera TaxID=29760 RepID=A0A438DRI2_VITVI|nr:Protein ECERIFERUM 26-like [Vitis vinifera]
MKTAHTSALMNSTNTSFPLPLFNLYLLHSIPIPTLYIPLNSPFNLHSASFSLLSHSSQSLVSGNGSGHRELQADCGVQQASRAGCDHKLSGLDHAMGLHTIHMIFYYGNNPATSFDLGSVPGVAVGGAFDVPGGDGRLIRGEDGNWVVNCNDAGVRVLRATVRTTLDEWLRSADGAEERDLTVWEDMAQDPTIWSPFRIQINEFEGGGIAIGLSCTHLHADPTCATLLLKSWSEAHRREAIAHPPFFHSSALRGRPVLNTMTKSANYYAAKSKAKPPSVKMAATTFRFSDSSIKQCLEEVHESCPDATPFDLLAALFWTSLAPMKEEIDNGRLGHVTGLVHEHVSSINEEECQSVIDWLESQKGEGGKFGAPFRMYGPELTCVSMEHMAIPRGYAGMFKDAKPVHIACHVGNVEGEGLIMVLPSPEEGLARTVMVTLPEEQMAKLCKDQAILRLEPTVVACGRQ